MDKRTKIIIASTILGILALVLISLIYTYYNNIGPFKIEEENITKENTAINPEKIISQIEGQQNQEQKEEIKVVEEKLKEKGFSLKDLISKPVMLAALCIGGLTAAHQMGYMDTILTSFGQKFNSITAKSTSWFSN